jgi:hypothetical protein
METRFISLASVRVARRHLAYTTRHDLHQRQCQLSRAALEHTFERVCVPLTLPETPSSRTPQNDKIVQTSFSESSPAEFSSRTSTEDEDFDCERPFSIQKFELNMSDLSTSDPDVIEFEEAPSVRKGFSTQSFPKPDL